MDINYTQIKLKNENEIFLREKHEVSIIVLDSQNLIQGKTFKNEDDKIKNFINEQMKFKDKGLFYDYIITKKGNVYKCTPDEKASTVLNFRHYSEEASILLPKCKPPSTRSNRRRARLLWVAANGNALQPKLKRPRTNSTVCWVRLRR